MKKIIGILLSSLLLALVPACDKNNNSSDTGVGTVREPMGEVPPFGMPTAPKKFSAMSPKTLFVGVNNEGADFGSLPGKDGSDWKFPTTQETDYWLTKGVNTFRVGIAWEREQISLNTPFIASYNNQLLALVAYATSKNINVLINPQNFMRWNNKVVGSSAVPISAFVDFWTRMAMQFKDNPRVLFGLNNEPNSMSSAVLLSAENQAIAAIRSTGAKNIITVPGNSWTGVASFNQTWVDADNKMSNATLFNQIKDSGNNWMIELHHYPDSDAGGGFDNNTCTRNPTNELAPVVTWLRVNNKRLIIGEYGTVNNANCQTLTAQYLQSISDNADVVKGILIWAVGSIWGQNPVYKLTLEPTDLGKSTQKDEPRVAWYQPFWQASTNPISLGATIPTGTTTAPAAPDAGVVVDSGTSAKDAGAVDSGATKVDAGATPDLTVSFTKRDLWDSGSCWNGVIKNNAKTSKAFHGMTVSAPEASLRDFWSIASTSKWGSKFPVILRPVNPQWIASGKSLSFGFCLDSKTPKVIPTASDVN